jgi:hypothetical protein
MSDRDCTSDDRSVTLEDLTIDRSAVDPFTTCIRFGGGVDVEVRKVEISLLYRSARQVAVNNNPSSKPLPLLKLASFEPSKFHFVAVGCSPKTTDQAVYPLLAIS